MLSGGRVRVHEKDGVVARRHGRKGAGVELKRVRVHVEVIDVTADDVAQNVLVLAVGGTQQ